MAILTITIPDSAAPRVQAALQVSTKAELEAKLKQWLRAQVAAFEASQIASQTDTNVRGEIW